MGLLTGKVLISRWVRGAGEIDGIKITIQNEQMLPEK